MSEFSDLVANTVTPKMVEMLEEGGIDFGELTDAEMDRLLAIVKEEGKNIIAKAKLVVRRLHGQRIEKVTITEKIVLEACAIAAKRFLAERITRHGP